MSIKKNLYKVNLVMYRAKEWKGSFRFEHAANKIVFLPYAPYPNLIISDHGSAIIADTVSYDAQSGEHTVYGWIIPASFRHQHILLAKDRLDQMAA